MSDVRQETPDKADEDAVERYRYALDWQEAFALRRWWQRLTLRPGELRKVTDAPAYPRGVRAALRRCESVNAVLLTEAFRHLWFSLESQAWDGAQANVLGKKRDQRLETWATIAAVVCELRGEAFGVPLGRRLGESKPGTDTPRMSDLRFQQLLDCHEPPELIRRSRRALKLAGNEGVSVVCLADSIALWWREQRGSYRPEATQRLAFILSNDYFGAYMPGASD